MKVFRLTSRPDEYRSIAVATGTDLNAFEAWWDGAPRSTQWEPVKVRTIEPHLKVGDLPALAGAPAVTVFSGRAIDGLSELLSPSGEMLQLDSDDGDLVAYNVTAMTNALDLAASKVLYFSHGGISWINDPVFDGRDLPTDEIFRIKEKPIVGVYVKEHLARVMVESGLEGFELTPTVVAP